jgi:hypothetical protein
VSPADRAKHATEAAERAAEAGDLRTAQAYRAAAATWERLARPRPSGWSHEPARKALAQVKRELAAATGPFQPPAPPKAPPPAADPRPSLGERLAEQVTRSMGREPATIEF